jgi:hypothetical protein
MQTMLACVSFCKFLSSGTLTDEAEETKSNASQQMDMCVNIHLNTYCFDVVAYAIVISVYQHVAEVPMGALALVLLGRTHLCNICL